MQATWHASEARMDRYKIELLGTALVPRAVVVRARRWGRAAPFAEPAPQSGKRVAQMGMERHRGREIIFGGQLGLSSVGTSVAALLLEGRR